MKQTRIRCRRSKTVISGRKIVLHNRWFNLVAKTINNCENPYYVIESTDSVSVLAVTKSRHMLMVRQYRPTLECFTLELPCGHIRPDEKPLAAAHREFLEETGHKAGDLTLLGVVARDTGRLGNKLWCYFASDVVRVQSSPDSEINALIRCKIDDLARLIKEGSIPAQDLATIFMAFQCGKLRLSV